MASPGVDDSGEVLTSGVGTPFYVPPEGLQYDPRVDMFALGRPFVSAVVVTGWCCVFGFVVGFVVVFFVVTCVWLFFFFPFFFCR